MRGTIVALTICALATTARADDTKAVQKAIKAQVEHLFGDDDLSAFADDAALTTNAMKGGVLDPKGFRDAVSGICNGFNFVESRKVKNLKVAFAGDDDAWASFEIHLDMQLDEEGDAPLSFDFRATELLARTDGTWKVTAGQWSKGVPDKDANRRAKQGKLTFEALGEADHGDAELIEQVGGALTRHEIHAAVSDRSDVVVYGTDKGKPRIGGKKTAKAWKAWFAATAAQDVVVTGAAQDGKVGWVVENLLVNKGKGAKAYKIPVRLFLVVAHEDAGWRVVAAQLAVPFDNYVD